jgi:hypothetical protein
MLARRNDSVPSKFFLALLAVLISLFLAVQLGQAQNVFERLVMPGPLVEGHAKLEKDCANCHESFVKGGQTKLCLDCHKPIANDLAMKKGMHGRRPDVIGRECRSCHSDHKGRAADIVQLDRQVFNHAFTNFDLKGSHTRVACEGCHVTAKKFRETAGRCFDCHKKNDHHKGGLGEACDGCHTEEAWRKVKTFDHSKTKFALTGAHAKVPCAGCHAGERYKGLATTCISCHQIQDVHAGLHGVKCEACHGTQAWKPVRFDHAKNTRFPLRGSHATLKCEACHNGDVYRDKLAMTCVSCHKKNDPHKGQLGTRCEQCHNETGWRQKVTFDHDVTRFPLIGLHAAVACEDCHRTPSFKDVSRTCSGCHKDTHHEGRLGTACATCHNPNGWARWRFDHDRQTSFALTGAHAGLTCHACHRGKAVAKVTAPTTCFGCHSSDDKHQGQFGRACEKCHSTATFAQGGAKR